MSDIVAGGPARSAAAVSTASTDATIAPGARALYVGTTGDITCQLADGGSDVVFKAVPVGFFPVRVGIVRKTGTTASDIVALF